MAGLGLNFLVTVGPLQKLVMEEAIKNGMDQSKVFWVEDVQSAAEVLKNILKPGDLWYLKGSLLKHMERIIYILEGENVSCKKISCHVYEQCKACGMLRDSSLRSE